MTELEVYTLEAMNILGDAKAALENTDVMHTTYKNAMLRAIALNNALLQKLDIMVEAKDLLVMIRENIEPIKTSIKMKQSNKIITDSDIIKAWDSCPTYAAMSRKLGISSNGVKQRIKKLGLVKKGGS